MQYCSTPLPTLKSTFFFPIKDSTPQSAHEYEFNHISEWKSLRFCSNEEGRQRQMLRQTNHKVWFPFNGVILKHRNFCPHYFKWVVALDLKAIYKKMWMGINNNRQILACRWTYSPCQWNALVVSGWRYIFKN